MLRSESTASIAHRSEAGAAFLPDTKQYMTKPSLQILDPMTREDWDDLLGSSHESSFFHSRAWASVLHDAYRFVPKYFTAVEGSKLAALIPVFEASSFLTGIRGVSLPFTDYCQPITNGRVALKELLQPVIEHGRKSGWKYLELRASDAVLPEVTPSSQFYGHVLDLTAGEKKIHAKLRSSTQRNIKKAVQEGVKVEFARTLQAIGEFYRLNCLTRREHGLPPQPFKFFACVHDHVISRGKGFVALASHRGEVIAGCVYFHFGRNAIYKYGASDRRFQHLRANNLIMWEAIRQYGVEGYESFCFGRTETENPGLRQFKQGWGPQEGMITYYRYDLRKNAFSPDDRKVSEFHKAVFRRMPIPLLRMAGNLLYRHMG